MMVLALAVLSSSVTAAMPGELASDDTCDTAELAPRIERLLGRAPTTEEQTFSSHVHRRSDGQWQLELELGDATEPRTFVAPGCDTVLDAAAFVVAIGVDPTLAGLSEPAPEIPAPPPRDEAPPASTPPPAATPPPIAAPVPASTPAKPRRTTGYIRLAGGIDGGGLPRVGALFEAAGGVRRRWWRAEIHGLFRLQSKAVAAANPAVGGTFSMWAVGARGCGVPHFRSAEFPICAGAEGGRVLAEGAGFGGAKRSRTPWAAALIGPSVALAIRPNIAFVIQATLGIPLVRTEFRVDDVGRVHHTGPVFGRGVIGFEGRFP